MPQDTQQQYGTSSIAGTIHAVVHEQVGQYSKTTVVIHHDTYTPPGGEPVNKYGAVEFFGNAAGLVADLTDADRGRRAVAHYRIDAREWTSPTGQTKWFPSLKGASIDIDPAPADSGAPASADAGPSTQYVNAAAAAQTGDDDERLPF